MSAPEELFKASLFDNPADVTYDDLVELPDMVITERDYQHDNNARATRGAKALSSHIQAHVDFHRGEDEMSAEIADMLADVRHLCDALNVDYQAADRTAAINHSYEVRGRRL